MRPLFASSRYTMPLCVAALLLLGGCQSMQQDGSAISQDLGGSEQGMDANEPLAIQAAETRAIADMGCEQAAGHVISREMVSNGFSDVPHYTIGVVGCGQRESVRVVCPPRGGDCIAGDVDK